MTRPKKSFFYITCALQTQTHPRARAHPLSTPLPSHFLNPLEFSSVYVRMILKVLVKARYRERWYVPGRGSWKHA